MKREGKVVLSVILVFAMVFSMFVSAAVPAKAASKKLKLSSKKVTVQVGKTKTIKVKNATKKAKWSVKSGKSVVQLTKKKKASVGIKGKKAGKAVVAAKVGKKTLTCKVTVKAAGATEDDKPTPSAATATQTPVVPSQAPTQVPTQAPTQNPTQPPSEAPSQTPDGQTGEAVKNVVIDMTKVGDKTFTASPAFINFASQLEDRFDLSYFSELKVGYELEFEGEDTSKLTGGKLAIAGSEEDLTGYEDGVAFTYNMMPGQDSVSIPISGDKATGKAVGINIQPMDADASYGWPETLKSVTITSIEFVAKPDAVYQAPGAGTPTPKPTVAPEFESSEFKYEGLDEEWIEKVKNSGKKVVAMSFDDGPGGYEKYEDYGTQIQDALTAAGAHATFFYIGAHIKHDEESKQEVARAKELGFEVANHSYDSAGLNSADAATIKDKIAKTDALLSDITGYKNFLFRAPNVAYSQAMYAVIEKPFIDVSIWSNDWQSSVEKDAIVKNVVDGLADGGIINMHSVHEKTAQAVPEILKACEEKGYQVVSVSELFAIKGKKLMTGVQYKDAVSE